MGLREMAVQKGAEVSIQQLSVMERYAFCIG
jgi:hypothetical protein